MSAAQSNQVKKRPPIVVVMGHVDHGKTTLLDYIKKTNVAAKEIGGITQAVGAYEITHNNEKITFIDTPGHEAFIAMRRRGSQVADIAVLVVAADEGVKPQTKEAYQVIEETKTSFVVVITKIDKNNADINRVKNELGRLGILLEGMGGNISWQAVSAKTGEGVKEFLDLLLLTAEVAGLSYDPQAVGRGFVLESHLDSRRGVVASVIIQDGLLRVSDEVTVGRLRARIKSLENFLGERIKSAEPSAPVLILGFSEIPDVGAEFVVGAPFDKKALAETGAIDQSAPPVVDDRKQAINLILAARDTGSLEALKAVISGLPVPEDYRIKVINEAVGDLTDGSVKLAISTGSIIVGFKVKVSKAADNLAKSLVGGQPVTIIVSEVIYELVDKLEEWLAKLREQRTVGELEILAIFDKKSGNKQVIGGKVKEGVITNNSNFHLKRGGSDLGIGRILNLQREKKDTTEAAADQECGLLVNFESEIKVGDLLVV